MRSVGQAGLGALLLALVGVPAFAQQAISARSGLIHYVEGKAFAGDQQVAEKPGSFQQIKENQVFRTTEGRAEVLLTPGVFLRLGENSSFRMITNRLIDTRLEFLGGSMILESDDMQKDNAVTVVASDATVRLRKSGIYRFDGDPAQLHVLKGTLDVETQGKTIELKEGKLLNLTGDMAIAKFDPKDTDALARWSYRRAEYVAMANVSAAKSVGDSGGVSSFYAANYPGYYPCLNTRSSLWYFNSYFGMYTYVPCSGRLSSPYGFLFWSPMTVYRVYAPRPVNTNWGNGGGATGYSADRNYSTYSSTSSGYSSAMSAPSYSSSSSSSGVSMSHGASGGGGAMSSGAGGGGGGGGMSHGGGGGGGGHR